VLKAVIDSNVLISALLNSAGKPRQVVSSLESSAFTFFYPKQLIAELQNAPSKPKLAAKVTRVQVSRLIDLLERKGVLTEPEQIPPVSRDPKDDVFLACAAACTADFLVTGDDDLLNLQKYGNTRIVTPREFLDILASGA
jgi:putative PIN family toxin of toxin-antitoxin system